MHAMAILSSVSQAAVEMSFKTALPLVTKVIEKVNSDTICWIDTYIYVYIYHQLYIYIINYITFYLYMYPPILES